MPMNKFFMAVGLRLAGVLSLVLIILPSCQAKSNLPFCIIPDFCSGNGIYIKEFIKMNKEREKQLYSQESEFSNMSHEIRTPINEVLV